MISFIKSNKLRITAIGFVVVFLISLIPVFGVSFYSHPMFDDFAASARIYDALGRGGSFFDVIGCAFDNVTESYVTWQGTFFSEFVFSLQPGVFSDNLYFLTTFILVISLSVSVFLLFDAIITRWLKSKREYSFIFSFAVLFCMIQFVPDKYEGFFWYNGATYYTLCFSIALIFFALLVRVYFCESRPRRIVLCILSWLSAICIGGGNYCTALTTVCLLALVIIVLIKNKSNVKHLYFITAAILIVSFIISIAAPGNAIRAAVSNGTTPLKAVALSVFYTFTNISKFTGLAQIALFALLTPLLYVFSKKISFTFKYPLLVVLLSFLTYATQLTPPLYAASSIGSGRQINIYYYSYIFFVLFSIFYVCGWINKNKVIKFNRSKVSPLVKASFLAVVFAVFICGCFNYSFHNLLSVDTALALINGSAKQYDIDYKNKIEEIKSGASVIDDITSYPDFFSNFGITTADDETNYWINSCIANYYGVEKFSASAPREMK